MDRCIGEKNGKEYLLKTTSELRYLHPNEETWAHGSAPKWWGNQDASAYPYMILREVCAIPEPSDGYVIVNKGVEMFQMKRGDMRYGDGEWIDDVRGARAIVQRPIAQRQNLERSVYYKVYRDDADMLVIDWHDGPRPHSWVETQLDPQGRSWAGYVHAGMVKGRPRVKIDGKWFDAGSILFEKEEL